MSLLCDMYMEYLNHIFISQGNDELQSVNMNALVGVLRQLASLSKHAETLFADLFNEVRHVQALNCYRTVSIFMVAFRGKSPYIYM